MKAESYIALAAINRGFDVALESLTFLQTEGVVTDDYVQKQTETTKELRANLNGVILNKLHFRENEDRDHYGMMRSKTEVRLRSS